MGFSLSHIVKGVVLAIVIYGLKIYFRGAVYHGKERLDGKTTLITGANTGIGKETARDFARRGARVILACRNLERCVKAAEEITAETLNHDIVVMKLNLASTPSIEDFARDINQQESRLNILVNNAGVFSTPEMKTEDGFEMQLGVNHLGHFLLTHLLLEKLKSSAPSRIVTVSSGAHKQAEGIDFDDIMMKKDYHGFKAYFRSKLANILFSRELAERLKGTGVTTYSVHPGLVVTEIARYMMDFPGSSLVNCLLRPIGWFFMKTPMEGAQTQIYCAVAPELANESGKYYSECAERAPSSIAQDDKLAKKLWEVSEELLELKKNG